MEEEEEQQSSKFEWSGSFDPVTYELENIADNSEYGYSGNQAFEIMDFESEIEITYEEVPSGGGGAFISTFSPDYSTYSYVLDGVVPSNLVFSSEINEDAGVFKIKIGGNLGLLKDYAPEFLLPENFTYDKYDSPDGFYQQGSTLIEAGGNYSYIVNQPMIYEIEFSIQVSLSDGPIDEETTKTKTTTKIFKIIINRNYSAMRNQFMAGYLDEQVARGDVDFFTYKGDKYYNSEDYLNALISDLGWSYYF